MLMEAYKLTSNQIHEKSSLVERGDIGYRMIVGFLTFTDRSICIFSARPDTVWVPGCKGMKIAKARVNQYHFAYRKFSFSIFITINIPYF